MNLQEIFDKVVTHLLTQNRPAMSSYGACAYRGTDGTMCAVGCLIKDESYSRSLEGDNVMSRDVQTAVQHSLGLSGLMDPNIKELLANLQGIHDRISVEDWSVSLQNTARRFGLQFNPPTRGQPT